MSEGCKFFINDCVVKSGAGCYNFNDKECDYQLIDSKAEAGKSNFKIKDCRMKATRSKFKVDTVNFDSTTSSTTLNQCKVESSQYNFKGSYKLCQQESTEIKAAIDCYQAGMTAEKYVAIRTQVLAGSHPFNGCTLDESWKEHSTFKGNTFLSGGKWVVKDSNWAGQVTFTTVNDIVDTSVKYADNVNLSKVCLKGDIGTIGANLNMTGDTHVNYRRLDVAAAVNSTSSKLLLETATVGSAINVTDNPIVNLSSVTTPTINSTGSFGDFLATDASTLNMTGSDIRTFSGSYGNVNIDGGSTLNTNGTSATVNSPAKAGVAVGGGVTGQIAGSDHKQSVNGNYHQWIQGDHWIRVTGQLLQTVEGNLLHSTKGSALYTSTGPIDITSTPRTPLIWIPGKFTPLAEPPS